EYADRPITAQQLGEFLYRVGRVKGYRDVGAASQSPAVVRLTQRPYPAGGALYELELYLAVRACGDIEQGLYHYDPSNHRLERRSGYTADVRRLTLSASGSTTVPEDRLQVLVIIAARLPRVAWKYSSIAYSLVLKHVGVLYQTMYLVATAMDLAPCAVGSGNADVFARAAGINYYEEASVGEFLLGSKREG
ncbi:MAG: SagB family peptide dehydrogenase, partial [Solirubrobacteraceae bacterium]